MTEHRTVAAAAGRWRVESGVHGACRITTRWYLTFEEADARARRAASANSTGDYWAVVYRGADSQCMASYNIDRTVGAYGGESA